MPGSGTAAVEIACEDDVRSAAMPLIGVAAARGTREGGPELAAKPIV